jgi:hypothetical protein
MKRKVSSKFTPCLDSRSSNCVNCGGAVGWGTALQAERSRVRFPMLSLEYFNGIILSGRTMAPGVDSACNRNEYQKYFLGGNGGWCVRLTTLPHSCEDCLEIWDPQSPGNLWACPGLEWQPYHLHVMIVLKSGILNFLEPSGPVQGWNDNLTTFMWWLSWNLGSSISWNPLGLSRAGMGLLYL